MSFLKDLQRELEALRAETELMDLREISGKYGDPPYSICLACHHGPPNVVSYFHCPRCHYQEIKAGRYRELSCPGCHMKQLTATVYEQTPDRPQEIADAAQS